MGQDLVTSEGVDEGSGDSVTEAPRDGAVPGTLGAGAVGTPENGEQNAVPQLVFSGEEPPGPGQRNEVGEG